VLFLLSLSLSLYLFLFLQEFTWSEQEVNEKLEAKMSSSFSNIWKTHAEKKVTLRTAAFMLALNRVLQARQMRGFA